MTDAIVRTLFRLFVTRRSLLEWVTAAQAKFSLRLDTRGFYRQMAGGVALRRRRGVVVALRRAQSRPDRGAVPDSCGCCRRSIARWASLPPPDGRCTCRSPPRTRGRLRLIARRTWRFFETFVDGGGSHAAADNFQEDPQPVVAHRTSPTNLGLYLLSVVAARDFGWLGTLETVERLEATLATHERARALPRPFLQLVRHARPASAGPEIRLVGRQRQSRRTSDRACAMPAGRWSTASASHRCRAIGSPAAANDALRDLATLNALTPGGPGASARTSRAKQLRHRAR